MYVINLETLVSILLSAYYFKIAFGIFEVVKQVKGDDKHSSISCLYLCGYNRKIDFRTLYGKYN